MIIHNSELNIKYTKGSGPGGEHKNKVESCVVLEHKSTGITVRCQETPSQTQNLKIAKELLIKKIEERVAEFRKQQSTRVRNSRIENQKVIRTYNEQRNEVKDHRTGKKYNMKTYMNGKLMQG